MSHKLWGRLSAAAAILMFAASAARAADAPPATGEGGVATILVTAQKESEDIQAVPLSMTAISGEKLDVITSSGGDIRVLSSRIPSLTLESSFGRTFPRPYIRGLGNTDFDLNASQPVSLVYDDVVLENPILKGIPLFDIDQVEALRGPQGTLFGRNTPAGVLKFDSAKPTFDWRGYGQVSAATYTTINAEAAVGGPIGEHVAFRLSGLYQHRSPWVDNLFTGQKNATEGYNEWAVRGQILWKPTDAFTALFNLHHMDLDGTPRVFRANIIQSRTNDFVPGYRRDQIAQDAQPRAFQHVNITGGIVKLTYDFGGPVLTSISAYEHAYVLSRGDIDGGFGASFAPPSGPGLIPFPSESADGLPHHRQITQEVRLAGDAGALHYQVGGYYFYENVVIDSFDYATLAGGVQDGFAEQHQRTRAWALFGTLTYHVNDQLSLTGGLRYSNDEKRFIAQRFVSPFGAPPVTRTANPSSDDLSWNANLLYEFNDDVNAYVRVAKGYRAPSIQGRLLFGDDISVANKETLISYEAGVKAYLFDRRLRANLAAYGYRVNNLQVTAVGGALNFNRLLNAKHANGYGFEADLEARPVDHLLMTAGLSYNHTEFDDPNLATAPCGGGCTVLDPPGALPGTVNIDGNPLPNAPRWIANVTARYGIPYGDGEFFVYTDWAYRSKINFFLYQSAEFSDDHLLEGGLRAGYSHHGGAWELAVFGRNITNDDSLEGGIDFNNLTGFVNDPRIWGVEFKGKF
ncbi:MAG TPA: TonB-dependent receptor [Caulobacteraceae bacterium]|nr:TonB-dependent receptor [Caulobacteraceae bacterium]